MTEPEDIQRVYRDTVLEAASVVSSVADELRNKRMGGNTATQTFVQQQSGPLLAIMAIVTGICAFVAGYAFKGVDVVEDKLKEQIQRIDLLQVYRETSDSEFERRINALEHPDQTKEK